MVKPSTTFSAWSQNGHPEKRICVLPFTDRTASGEITDRVREGFFGRLALKRFTDLELRELDARLHALPEPWNKVTPQKLGSALPCDALVYGEILEASNLYVGVYAQLTLEGRIQLVDAATGQTLLVGTHATKFRLGGVPFSLLDLIPDLVLNMRNFSGEQGLRAVDDLARNLADQIPDLPDPATVQKAGPIPVSTEQAAAEHSEQKRTGAPLVTSTCPDQNCYQVQVAAFHKSGEAQQAVQLLRGEGFQPTVVTAAQSEKSQHRVMLGPFSTFGAAQETGAKIPKRLRFSPVVVRFIAR
ncbi:MAG: SPOR domain-containing protein [Deltaproteobacteria bacterium]|nr:SPOR domain-containing protein [Deltaproteobacteria bacterium]